MSTQAGDPDSTARGEPSILELAVVRYADEPDRCTIFPSGTEEPELMTTWLSANRSALVSLESNR